MSLIFPALACGLLISAVSREINLGFTKLACNQVIIPKFYVKGAKLCPVLKRVMVIFRDFLGCVPTTDPSIEDPKDLVKTNCQYYTFEKS